MFESSETSFRNVGRRLTNSSQNQKMYQLKNNEIKVSMKI